MAKSDFLKIVEEVRGTGAPEAEYTTGIYWELTIELHNGNPGIYGDILAKYAEMLIVDSKVDDFNTKYADFLVKYADFLTKYADVLVMYTDIQAIQIDVHTARDEAVAAADAILTLTTTAEQVDANDDVEVDYDALTGNMHFKIPEGTKGEVEVSSTTTLAPGAIATVVDSNPEDSNVAKLDFGIPEGIKGDSFVILGQKTVAEIDALTPNKGDAWQTTDVGSIAGLPFQVGEIAYGNDISWLNIGALGAASGGFEVRGTITLNADTSNGVLHDDTLGDIAVDETGFPGGNPGVPNSAVYVVDAATTNNGITGAVINYIGGETLSFLEGATNPWFLISASVNSFNGRVGDVTPELGDYTKAQVGLGNADDTSDMAKPISNAGQAAFDLKVDKTSDTGSAQMPAGTVAERDGTVGAFRFNSERNQFEGRNNSEWGAVGGAPDASGLAGYELGTGGTGINDTKWSPIRTNPNVLSTDYAMDAGTSGVVTSGFEIADGVDLEIPDTSALSLV